jgi:glycine dehydrogenase subunit 1
MESNTGFTHPYVPNAAPAPRRRLLDALGLDTIDELYAAVPDALRLKGRLDLPDALPGEADLRRHVETILAKNRNCGDLLSFLGGGCARHYVPAICDEITGRGEFLTAYGGGPYSDHGKGQAIFEFQSLLGELVGMDAVSPPTYDWGAAADSAALMACRITGRSEILVPSQTSPDRLSQMRGFVKPFATMTEIDQDPMTGLLDLADLMSKLSGDTAAVYVENPAFLGAIETQVAAIVEAAHGAGALAIVGVDPISLGVLAAPADYGADIVVGDIQPLGIHMLGGGGCAGFIATRDEERFVMEFPSILISAAPATGGGYGFAWSTTERTSYDTRHEATDYYGTTQWLWAIGAAVYLSLMGPDGMRELGTGIMQRARYAATAIDALPGLAVPALGASFFKEFVVDMNATGKSVDEINAALLERGILGGSALDRRRALYCVTEMHTKADIDRLVDGLKEVCQ